jgi:hypothetical protein
VFVAEGAEGLERPLGPMQLIEVDDIGLEPAERGLDRRGDVVAG